MYKSPSFQRPDTKKASSSRLFESSTSPLSTENSQIAGFTHPLTHELFYSTFISMTTLDGESRKLRREKAAWSTQLTFLQAGTINWKRNYILRIPPPTHPPVFLLVILYIRDMWIINFC